MIHPKMGFLYVGIDSHKNSHTAVIMDCFYTKLAEITFENAPNKFDSFLKQVNKHKSSNISLMVGLEDVSVYGRTLAMFLIKKGCVVKHVNSSLVAHERRSLNVLQKTDEFDAECAARVLLNRFEQLPEVNLQDKFWTLSQLVTRRRSIVKGNTALKNHLQFYIAQHYPNHKKFFNSIDAQSSLAFFEAHPSPQKLDGVTVSDIVELLMKNGHAIHKEEKAKLILDCVKKDGYAGTEFQDVHDSIIVSAIRQIRSNKQEIKGIELLIKDFLKQFDYKLESMKGIDTITAATLIAEIGDIERFPTPAKLAKYAAASPVTYSSGKSEVQYANKRGNRILNATLFSLAVTLCNHSGKNNKIANSYIYDYYIRKLSEGKTKKQALKCVERRLVNIIWGMMKHKTEYRNPPVKQLEVEPAEAGNKK